MSDDPFPNPVTRIGTRTFTLVFPEGLDNEGQVRTPYAYYKVELWNATNEIVEVEEGVLFEVGGIDLLTVVEKNNLIDMDERLKSKAEIRWVPS